MRPKPGKAVNTPSLESPRKVRRFEGLLVFACSVILASRCQMNESFPAGWRISGPPETVSIAMPETPAMLLFAGILFTLFAVWLIRQLCQTQFLWRHTSLGIPLLLLIAGGILSCRFASNKNTALISSFTLIAQVLLAILLVQRLDTPQKRQILLGAIAAAGAVLAYRCMEQHYYELPELTESFRQNPEAVFAAQGIEPGSFTAEQFAGRITSRDVGGFFAISNTAAAMLLLSLFATASLAISRRPGKLSNLSQWISFLLLALIFLIQGFALLLTKSKGGIAAAALAAFLAVGIFLFRKILSRHWRAAFITAGILLVVSVSAIIAYGLTHNRLPSASMWVRWQYWTAAAAMIADHPLTGVGPQNFGEYYPRYMDPAAPEVVMDPHSLPVSIWAQWGLFGFLAMVWAILAVSIRLCRPAAAVSSISNDLPPPNRKSALRIVSYGVAIAISIGLIRRAFSHFPGIHNPQELLSVYLLMFFMPALVWLISFVITQIPDGGNPISDSGRAETIALGAGILGFLIHNGIDMAFFQPGVGTCFFAMLAALLAAKQSNHASCSGISFRRRIRIAGIIGCLLLGAVVWATMIPAIQAYNQARQAQMLALAGQMDSARHCAERAMRTNPLDPDPPFLLAQLHWNEYLHSRPPRQESFDQAVKAFQIAAQRDPENFRGPQSLAELYDYASAQTPDQPNLLNKAAACAEQTLRLHPAKSELYVFYGDLLIRQNKPDQALEVFQKALDLEQDYQRLHQRMFPGAKDLKQRMNPQLWKKTQERIKSLQNEWLNGKMSP